MQSSICTGGGCCALLLQVQPSQDFWEEQDMAQRMICAFAAGRLVLKFPFVEDHTGVPSICTRGPGGGPAILWILLTARPDDYFPIGLPGKLGDRPGILENGRANEGLILQ